MKIIFTVAFVFVVLSSSAQIRADFSAGVLQSVGANKAQLISSLTQGVAVTAITRQRYQNVGLRARGVLSHKLPKRFNVHLQTGFNFRGGEYLWGDRFAYVSIPLQGGVGYKLIDKERSSLSLNSFSGINIFKIHNKLVNQEGGFIQSGELSYAFIRSGFLKSILLKAGYEYQVDSETFFYKSIDTLFKDEDFFYKIRRNQVYLAVGVGL